MSEVINRELARISVRGVVQDVGFRPFIAGITVDEYTLYTDFLSAMDWDAETTIPSRKKLLKLGLNDISAEFYP